MRIPDVPVYYSFTYLLCRDNASDSRGPDLLIFTDANRGLYTAHLVLHVHQSGRKFLYPYNESLGSYKFHLLQTTLTNGDGSRL